MGGLTQTPLRQLRAGRPILTPGRETLLPGGDSDWIGPLFCEAPMTPDSFSDLAMRLGPDVQARAVLDAVQFRVGGRAFATLGWPAAGWAVIKVDAGRQAWALSLSDALAPEPGRRRKAGIVLARLSGLETEVAVALLGAAWRDAQRRRSIVGPGEAASVSAAAA
jgi:hypothetical protein